MFSASPRGKLQLQKQQQRRILKIQKPVKVVICYLDLELYTSVKMFEFYPASSCDHVPLKVLCVLLDFLVPIPMSCMRSAILLY